MRVFITGGTGYVGSVTVDLLLEKGHSVLALVKSDLSASILKRKGCEVLHGDLEEPEGLKEGARQCDGVIHLGYIHKFDEYERCARIDKAACLAMLSVMEGTNKPFVYTCGTAVLEADKEGGIVYEDSPYSDPQLVGLRGETERELLQFSKRGVRISTIRLPPSVHGDLDAHGFIPILMGTHRERGFSFYVGDGSNRWPAVNYKDTPSLYVLALEKGRAGAKYNAVDETAIPFKQIAETMGKRLGVPTRSCTQEEAQKSLSFAGIAAGMDNQASSEITRKELGWKPTHPGLLSDLMNYYG